MNKLTIEFIDFDTGSTLGCVERTGIIETLIPTYKLTSNLKPKPVFFKKRFGSTDCFQWVIKHMYVENIVAYIFLKPADEQPISIAQFAKDQCKPSKHYLRKYQLVDVDFGFHSDIYDGLNKKITKNSIYLSTILPEELYKKRPCIILQCKGELAQVLPLSTKEQGNDPTALHISKESFKDLHNWYSKKDSYALLTSIQTVSTNRIFPAKMPSNHNRKGFQPTFIHTQDRKNITEALLNLHSTQIISELKTERTSLENEKKQKAKLMDANKSLREELTKKRKELEELTRKILDVGKSWNIANDDVDAIIAELKL